MNYTFVLFFILTIPYIGYSQNASNQIAGKYVCSKSTGWYNATDPSTGNGIEVAPMPISETTLILDSNGTFTRSIVMFSGNRETVEKGNWSIMQDSLVLHIKTSKPAYISFETETNTEERLKIDIGSSLIIKRGEVYSKTE